MIDKIKSFLFENKTDKQTIIKNSVWIWLSDLIFKFSQIIVTILIARIFWVEIFWIYAYFWIIISILLIFSDIWITQLLIRDYQHVKNSERKSYFLKWINIKIVLSFIIFIIFIIYWKLFINDSFTFNIWILLLIIWIINSFLEYIKWVFRSLKLSEIEFKIKFFQWLIYLLLIFIILFTQNIILMLIFNIIIYIIVLIYSYIQLLKREFVSWNFIAIQMRYMSLIKKWYIYALSWVLITLYYYIDTIMIKNYIWYNSVWIYNAAYKIVLVAIMPIWIFTSSLFPVLSGLYNNNKKEYYNVIHYYSKIIFFFSILVIPIFIGLSPKILMLLFWSQYVGSWSVLQLLLISVIFLYLNAVYAVWLQVSWNEKKFLVVVFLASLFNGATNFLIIPLYGVYWAAYTTIGTEILLTIFIVIIFYYDKTKNEKIN